MGALAGASALAGCGYVIYPERRGQSLADTKIDAMIVVLDGLLCLLGLVPGIIAFIVDVSSGCIYMPREGRGPTRGFVRVRARGKRRRDFEEAIAAATGMELPLDDPRLMYVAQPLSLDGQQVDDLRFDTTLAIPASDVRLRLGPDDELLGFVPPS
jgi:hypothetical protein